MQDAQPGHRALIRFAIALVVIACGLGLRRHGFPLGLPAFVVKYGGHGYGHVLENIVPRMWERGWSEQDVHSVLIANPARILTFV